MEKPPRRNSVGRPTASAEMTLPARSRTTRRRGLRSTRTSSDAVRKPTNAAPCGDCGCTSTDFPRGPERTAHEESSGNAPPGAMRTRRMSSRRAVIRKVAETVLTSTPSRRGWKLLTASSVVMSCEDEAACTVTEASAVRIAPIRRTKSILRDECIMALSAYELALAKRILLCLARKMNDDSLTRVGGGFVLWDRDGDSGAFWTSP